MVGVDETMTYIGKAEEAGCSITSLPAEGQGHGFKQEYYMDDYLKWIQSVWNRG